LSLCLASAGVVKTLSIAAFTLAWTHSIEKVDWQEDWRVTPQGLELVQARVKGSGAGMEPPPEARLVDGWFQWQPEARADAGSGARQFRRRRRMAAVQRWQLPDAVGDFRASGRRQCHDDERL
jgi:hypothetical protein